MTILKPVKKAWVFQLPGKFRGENEHPLNCRNAGNNFEIVGNNFEIVGNNFAIVGTNFATGKIFSVSLCPFI